MAEPKQFTTREKTRDKITFHIDDDEFTFTPHKVAGVMLPFLEYGRDDTEAAGLSMTQRIWDWLRDGLDDGQYLRIRERLEDPDDTLDFPDVARVTRWLIGEVTERPTERRSG